MTIPPAEPGTPVPSAVPASTVPAYGVVGEPISAVQPQAKTLSTTSMVLALVSIVFGFTFVLPLAALVFGIVALKKEPAGRAMAIVGIVVGALDLLVWAVLLILFFAFFAALVGLSVSS